MKWESFRALPDDASVWIFGFQKSFSELEQEILTSETAKHLAEWVTHGNSIQSAFDLVEERFIIVAGFSSSGISGCSIDSLLRLFKRLKEDYALDGLDRGLVFFRDASGVIQSLNFNEFADRVQNGDMNGETPVFDTTIQSLSELRQGLFERAFNQSWHARRFQLLPS